MRIECAHTELVNIENIIPHPSNRNRHSQKQIEVLAKIIAKNGQRSPIVISNRSRYVVKGHGRLEAIKLLGWDKCAVDYQDYESDLEELNDRIADNEIARYSEFDQVGFLDDLKALDLDPKELDLEEFGKIDFAFLDDEIKDIDEVESGDINTIENFHIRCKEEVELLEVKQYFDTDTTTINFKKFKEAISR